MKNDKSNESVETMKPASPKLRLARETLALLKVSSDLKTGRAVVTGLSPCYW
jgi:hypothetical protein